MSVLAMGRPMWIDSPGRTRESVDQMVVSVGAVHVPELAALGQELVGQVARHGFAAAEHFQLRVAGPLHVEEQAPGRGCGLQEGDIVRRELMQQAEAVGGVLAAEHDELRAGNERQEELEAGDVEGDRGHGQQHVLGGHAGRGLHREEEVDQRLVRDFHALGQAG